MIGAGVGEFGIGGFPDADSLSVGDPLPGLVSDPTLAREFLLRSTPGGVEVDLSSSGYNSLPADTPYKLFPSAISRPYNFNVELPLPNLSGGASLGAGEILVKNSDGAQDAAALEDWLGADADVYIGRKTASLSAFTRFFKGKSAGVSWDLDSFSILHRDLRFKLQKRLQPNLYMGTGAALRFSALSDQVSYGDILDPIGSFSVEVLFRSTDTANNKVLFSKKAAGGAANPGWRALILATTMEIFADIADGTNQVSIAIPYAGYLDGGLHRISFVVDRVVNVFRVYVDGDLIGTSANISGVGSLASTQPMLVGNRGSSGQAWIGDLDDFRYWSKVLSPSEIQSNMFKEITAQSNLEIYSKFNEGAGTGAVILDSSGNGRTGTLTGTTWVGSLEGDSSIAGTPKPILVGIKRQISPKLVDSIKLVYQVHDGGVFAIDEVADGGDAYTFGADVSDIYASTPAAGSYNTCIAKGLFRLGSSPVGVITATVRGDNAGSLGYVDTMSGIHRKVITRYGGMADGDLNLGTYTALLLKTTAKIGFYWDSEINVDVALDEIMKQGGSGWWAPDRVARASVGRIDDPATLEPDITITEDDLVEPKNGGVYRRTPVGVRVGKVVLGYRHYNTTLTEDQVAGAVDLATRYDLGKAYRFVTATDPDAAADADTMTVYTEIDEVAAAQAEADRLLALWKVDRGIYRVTMDQGVLSYFIGTVFNMVVSRYDTVAGKKFIATGIAEDMGQYGQTDRLEPVLFG